MADIDSREDGAVEVIEVKLNNRKTKNWETNPKANENKGKIEVAEKNVKKKINNVVRIVQKFKIKLKQKLEVDLKCQTEEKATFRKPQLVNIKYIFIQVNMMTEK